MCMMHWDLLCCIVKVNVRGKSNGIVNELQDVSYLDVDDSERSRPRPQVSSASGPSMYAMHVRHALPVTAPVCDGTPADTGPDLFSCHVHKSSHRSLRDPLWL